MTSSVNHVGRMVGKVNDRRRLLWDFSEKLTPKVRKMYFGKKCN